MSSETVNIIFWDGIVSVNPAAFQMMNDKIIVVTTTSVRECDSILHLIGTKGTKVYFDPDISEAHKLRLSLSQKGLVISKKRIMDISNVQTIDYIQYMVTKEATVCGRILIQFRIKDNIRQQDLTAFEEVATELVGKTRDEFIALDRTGGNAAVQAVLDEMVIFPLSFCANPW